MSKFNLKKFILENKLDKNLQQLNENSPGFDNRKFGEPLPTLESIKTAYEAKEVNEDLTSLVRDLTPREYKMFAKEMDIDEEDANQMMDFLSNLDDREAEFLSKKLEKGDFKDVKESDATSWKYNNSPAGDTLDLAPRKVGQSIKEDLLNRIKQIQDFEKTEDDLYYNGHFVQKYVEDGETTYVVFKDRGLDVDPDPTPDFESTNPNSVKAFLLSKDADEDQIAHNVKHAFTGMDGKDVYDKYSTEKMKENIDMDKVFMKGRGDRKVDSKMWSRMDDEHQMDALLSVFKDPDDAEMYVGEKWDDLPEEKNFMTTTIRPLTNEFFSSPSGAQKTAKNPVTKQVTKAVNTVNTIRSMIGEKVFKGMKEQYTTHGGYVELMDLDDHLDGIHYEFERWREGPSTEITDIEPAKEDVISYVVDYLRNTL